MAIDLPLSPETKLLKAENAAISLEEALKDVERLNLFLGRHYWNVTRLVAQFRFKQGFSHMESIGGLSKCLKMLASMDRDISNTFEVKIQRTNANEFEQQVLADVEEGLQSWVRTIYQEHCARCRRG